MNTTTFSRDLRSYIEEFLPKVRNYSANTVSSYQDAFRLLLLFFQDKKGIKPHLLDYKHITSQAITEFLSWLKEERHSSSATCNQRLAAITSFLKYGAQKSVPAFRACSSVCEIPSQKVQRHNVSYFSVEEMKLILNAPNAKDVLGRRDIVLLSLFYDSGARAQEICNVKIQDITFAKPAHIILHGKGKKTRTVPLSDGSAKLVKQFISEKKQEQKAKDQPLFLNRQGSPITPACVRNLTQKYVDIAKEGHPDLFQGDYSPHSFRHSKAVHLLEAGVELVYIRDFLGHSSVQTTEIYAKVSQAMLNETLRNRQLPSVAESQLPPANTDGIPDFLKNQQ